jgi:hypothetical protein
MRRGSSARRTVRIKLTAFAGTDRRPDRHRHLSRQAPCGSKPLPSPARMDVWMVIVASGSVRRRVAVRVEAVAFAGADRGAGGHLPFLRQHEGESRSDRAAVWMAIAAQPWPWGQIPGPSAARTCVVVCISASFQPVPELPWGQTPVPSAARTWVVVFIFRILSMDGGVAPGSAAARAGIAVGTDAGAFGCANVGGGVHRFPLDVGLLCRSAAAGVGVAVGAEPGAFACADVGGDAHRMLPWVGFRPRGGPAEGGESRLPPRVQRGMQPAGDEFGMEAPREGRVMRGDGTNRRENGPAAGTGEAPPPARTLWRLSRCRPCGRRLRRACW